MAQYAAHTSSRFWFQEFKQFIAERQTGHSPAEIKRESQEHNLFKQPSISRAKDMIGVVSKRVESLSDGEMTVFSKLDLENQKLLNLITIFRTDRLFFEFAFTDFADALMLNETELQAKNIVHFIETKQTQDEHSASWSAGTVKRVAGHFRTFLYEANLLNETNQILAPIIDPRLKQLLIDQKDLSILKALGVNE